MCKKDQWWNINIMNTTQNKCIKKENMWVGMRICEELVDIYRDHSLTRLLIIYVVEIQFYVFWTLPNYPDLKFKQSMGLVQIILSEKLWKCIQIIYSELANNMWFAALQERFPLFCVVFNEFETFHLTVVTI